MGEDNLETWHGDDWNDYPYDCNAGRVYQEFIAGYRDIAFPFDSDVLEPCDGYQPKEFSKDDMRLRRVPCIIVVPPEEASWGAWDFGSHVGSEHVQKFYFGDPMDPEKEKE